MSSKAELFLKAGDPVEALAALQDEVRAKPADSKLRIFLFQLMIVNGQWERASKQLAVLSDMDEEALFMVRAYEDVINCERHREAVFAGKVRPIVFGEPEAWVATLIEALHAHCHGETEQFKTLNEQALEAAPTIAGRINDEGFEWLADADQRFGPVFEMMFNQHYYWVPMSRVKRITTEAPSDLRDLVWLPAEVTWTNGGQAMVMMPARYPDLASTSPQGLLGQHTDWQTGDDGIESGRGQRMLASDVTDYSFLQVRTIEFDS